MELREEQLKKLEAYLYDIMTLDEKANFELEVDASTELQEFIRLFNETKTLEDDTRWDIDYKNATRLKKVASLYKDKETQEFSEKIRAHRHAMSPVVGTANKTWLKPLVLAAAAACLAVLVYINLPKEQTLSELYTTYSTWEELPSVLVKGDDNATKKLAVETAFQQKQYDSTITLSNKIIENAQKVAANMLLYKGAAHLELGEFDQALQTYKELLVSDSIDNHKAYWYIAMTYLKKGDRQMTIAALENVLLKESNYKFATAKEVLELIE